MLNASGRKRLKKAVEEEKNISSSSEYRIPKKTHSLGPKEKVDPNSKNKLENHDSDEDSLDDFISDKIVYVQSPDVLGSSSEESAHSTDEDYEGRPVKRHRTSRRKRESSDSGKSARETDSERSELEEFENGEEEGSQEPKQILVGKKALEAKRAQGLLPEKRRRKSETSKKEPRVKKEKLEKPEKQPKPPKEKKEKKDKKDKNDKQEKKEKSQKSLSKNDTRKYIQYAEYESPEERKKAEVITKILIRWWYALPDWPPVDYNYAPLLADRNLFLASQQAPETPVPANKEKVREIPGYPGLFQGFQGKIYDLRPHELCPCFNTLFPKDYQELLQILIRALESQFEQLVKQEKYPLTLRQELEKELAFYRKKLKI